jgi:hypothetical protein
LKGLEGSVIRVCELENLLTLGSEYYSPLYVQMQATLQSSHLSKDTLSSLCSLITDGDHGVADYQDEGIPFILSENVKEGWIDVSQVRRISRRHHSALARSSVKAGDVLVTKTGVYFGKSAVVGASLGEANTIAHVGILRPKATISARYLSTFLNSKYGQSQLRRRGIKATRPEIKLIEFRDIEVPLASKVFQDCIEGFWARSQTARSAIEAAFGRAEVALLASLGLADWTPPEPLSYSARASEALSAGRLDARFFAPRIQALLDILWRDGRSLGDVVRPRRQKFRPQNCDFFNYIEIGDIDGAGEVASTCLASKDAPSRASWHVRPGDIISSTVRPIRRLSAQIAPDQNGYVCSSGLVVIDPRQIAPELLLTFLRLPAICDLLDLYASASMYPAITDDDIFGLPFPKVDFDVEVQIVANVQEAWQAKAQVAQLLEAIKRAVEIAIEDGESVAMSFLDVADRAS